MDADTETYDINEDNNSEETGFDEPQQGESIAGRETVIEELFDTEKRIELLRRNWRGDYLTPNENGHYFWKRDRKKVLAGDRFINKQIAALRAICNPTNSFSKKPYIELKRILHDAVDAFIRDMVNESTVKRKDYRSLAKMYEHFIEMFMGLPEAGHGSKVLRDALAGINTPDKDSNKETFTSSLAHLYGEKRR